MLYIVAEYNDKGLKQPRLVSLNEAQELYNQKCFNASEIPSDLSVIDYSCAFVGFDKRTDTYEEFLWIVPGPSLEQIREYLNTHLSEAVSAQEQTESESDYDSMEDKVYYLGFAVDSVRYAMQQERIHS